MTSRAIASAALFAVSTVACTVDSTTFFTADGGIGADAGTADAATALTLVVEPPQLEVDELSTRGFTVGLNRQPAEPVEVTLFPSSDVLLDVTPSSFTFTEVDWSEEQIVLVAAADDVDDDNENLEILLSTDATLDVNYDVLVVDDDAVNLVVTPQELLTITEMTSGTYDVVLSDPPLDTVTVTVTSLTPAIATVDPSELTFTTTDWNAAQSVTVNGVDDVNITSPMTNVVFEAPDVPTVMRDVLVNDVDEFEYLGESIGVIGETSTATIYLRMSHAISADVVAQVYMSAPGIATLDVSTLTFTAENWSTYQSVTVTPIVDGDTDDETFSFNAWRGAGYTPSVLPGGVIDDET